MLILLFDGKNELDCKDLIISVGVNDKNVGVKTYEKVLSLIVENKKLTIEEIANLLNKSTRTIERTIKKLKEDNKIVRIGSDKTGCWVIK